MKFLNSLRLIALSLLTMLLCSSCGTLENVSSPAERTPSYLVLETYSGRILFTQNPNELRPIGMLANVATSLVVLDWVNARNIDMDRMLIVPASACQWPQTNLLHLRPGDRISLRDALHSALMWDDSACAATLAYACGSTINPQDPEGAFVSQMNQMARMIGMRSTWFKGSSGAVITQSNTHDIARLGLYALQKPALRNICSQRSYVATVNGSRTVTIVNSNSMLGEHMVDGMRAARSGAAGACLLVSATRASIKLTNPRTGRLDTYPQRLLIVVLGARSSQSRYQIAQMMLRDGWGAWEAWQKADDFTNPYQFITLPR